MKKETIRKKTERLSQEHVEEILEKYKTSKQPPEPETNWEEIIKASFYVVAGVFGLWLLILIW